MFFLESEIVITGVISLPRLDDCQIYAVVVSALVSKDQRCKLKGQWQMISDMDI